MESDTTSLGSAACKICWKMEDAASLYNLDMPPNVKTRNKAQAQAEAEANAHVIVPPALQAENLEANNDNVLVKGCDFVSTVEGFSVVLTTIVDIQDIPQYGGWISRLEVTFDLALEEYDGQEVEAGNLIGYVLNRTLRTNTGAAFFIRELLARDTLGADPETGDDDPTYELRRTCRMLYTKQGAVKGAVGIHEMALSEERIVVIDKWQLENQYRGTGLSTLALKSFHDLMRQFLEVIPFVCSPARIQGSTWGKGLSNVEVEQSLVRVYESQGYSVWIQGAENVVDSMTIMGRLFEEWDNWSRY